MQVTENLLQRFYDQQCSAEEADTVVSYLRNNPEVVEQWLGPDWQQAGKDIPIPVAYRNELWKRVKASVEIEKPIRSIRVKQYISVAAAFILLLCSWMFFTTDKNTDKTTAQLVHLQQEKPVFRTNTTNAPININMPDGSTVILDPGSVIKYAKGFKGKERKIILSGSGFFEVSKNPNRPFIVVSGDITTTALGTSFRVTENAENVTVKLYTGKVVVNKIGSYKNWSGPVYLLPGTAMTYSIKQMRTTVAGFVPEKTLLVAAKKHGLIKKKTTEIATELVFDNAPLADVLKAIEQRFGVIIKYDETVIDNHYFTGKVLPTDAAETLLHVIGNMNGLTIKENGSNHFQLTKKQ